MSKLRVWWNPIHVPESFYVDVQVLAEAKLVLDNLAAYDNYLVEKRIIDDRHGNTGGLEEFDEADRTDGPDGSWCEWESSDGESINTIDLPEAAELDRLKLLALLAKANWASL